MPSPEQDSPTPAGLRAAEDSMLSEQAESSRLREARRKALGNDGELHLRYARENEPYTDTLKREVTLEGRIADHRIAVTRRYHLTRSAAGQEVGGYLVFGTVDDLPLRPGDALRIYDRFAEFAEERLSSQNALSKRALDIYPRQELNPRQVLQHIEAPEYKVAIRDILGTQNLHEL